MDKSRIIKEIRRSARKNGDEPLGRIVFESETGIGMPDWLGIHWAKWGDALVEAGFESRTIQETSDESYALKQMVALIRQLRKFPTLTECRRHPRTDNAFPCIYTIQRLGLKHECAAKVSEYCRSQEGFDDVISICETVVEAADDHSRNSW